MNFLQKYRPQEWSFFDPLPESSLKRRKVKRMLELGGKYMTRQGVTYKSVFEALGFEHISVDWNGEHGALSLDLREPLDLGTFGLISNIGTTEHVSHQEPVWRNIDEAAHPGTVFVSITPRPGDWRNHGAWYPTREFYELWSAGNGWIIERLEELYEPPVRCLGVRAIKVKDGEHWWPGDQYLYFNGG